MKYIPFFRPTTSLSDGVIAPDNSKLEIVNNEDFNKIRFFGSTSAKHEHAYLAKTRANETLYDLDGQRREMFVSLTVGIAPH